MNGIRVWPSAEGWLDASAMMQPGAYGRATNPNIKPGSAASWWEVTAPDGSMGVLSPELHTVTEHEDGTITVHPSIDFSKRRAGAFHGWLQRGVWRDC